MAIEGISSAFQSFKEHVVKPIFGRFFDRTVTKASPLLSSSVKQAPKPENDVPDKSLTERKVRAEVKPRSILKTTSEQPEKRNIGFNEAFPSHGPMTRADYDLSTHEQNFLHELLVNTRPGRVRQFIYKLHLSAPSHPKKEVAEFKNYLKESATSIEQLEDIRTYLSGEKLADCQLRRAMKEHKQELVASRFAEVIVETQLARISKSGDQLKGRLEALLDKPGGITNKLRSHELYKALARDTGLEDNAHPKSVLAALDVKKLSHLQTAVTQKLEQYLSNFNNDPLAAQDIIDTAGDDYRGPEFANNKWDNINERREAADPVANYKNRTDEEGEPRPNFGSRSEE